jgi:hypothetical protein
MSGRERPAYRGAILAPQNVCTDCTSGYYSPSDFLDGGAHSTFGTRGTQNYLLRRARERQGFEVRTSEFEVPNCQRRFGTSNLFGTHWSGQGSLSTPRVLIVFVRITVRKLRVARIKSTAGGYNSNRGSSPFGKTDSIGISARTWGLIPAFANVGTLNVRKGSYVEPSQSQGPSEE